MPEQVKIINRSRGRSAILARYCTSFSCRLRGLMFRKSIPDHWGLLMVYPRDSRMDTAIHMLFMGFDLAVVWINNAGEVVDVRLARRWRPFYQAQKAARYVLEMSTGHLDDFKVGDLVSFETAVD